MAQHLIGLNLTCQIVCSVLNAHMIYPNLNRAAMVYPRALYTQTAAFLTVHHSSQFSYFLILTQSPFVC